ncbi:F-box/FBD/LRR-repeat protein At5g53840 [Linum perenne]
MRKKIKSSTIADGSSTEDDDRISSLPDEILHEILYRLGFRKQSTKAALLSKRWNHLWLSYPVLEFYCTDYSKNRPSRSTMDSFIAAARRKLSYSGLNSYIKSLRIISLDSAFIGAILDLIQNREPEEIYMNLNRDSVIPAPLLNSSRLRTLMLYACKILEQDQSKMINLQVIHLSDVSIDVRVLNSMIAAAPLLEKLTLICLYSIKRVEVGNHANLKHIQMKYMSGLSEIVVGALQSLESLSLRSLDCDGLEIICSSLLPSLKSLEIRDCPNLRDHVIHMLTSKSPSLLSLHLADIKEVKELKIKSLTLEKLELDWYNWHPKRLMLHIDAPSLVNVCFRGQEQWLRAISLQAAQSCRFKLSFYNCYYSEESHKLKELKDFLRKVTQKIQFVHLHLYDTSLLHKRLIECDQVHQDDSPTPVIERVEVNYNKIERVEVKYNQIDQAFVYNMLWSCHPKYFSVHDQRDESLKLINQAFMERTSPSCKKIACKCWRHQLKDVKIVMTNDKEDEELMDVSDDVLSTLECRNQVLFRLIWH